MSLNLDLQIGTSFDWQLGALNPDESVPTGQFLSSDTLVSYLWQGSTDIKVATLTATWLNATDAEFQISFDNSTTASLAQGQYYVYCTATRGSRSASLVPYGTTVTLKPAPGTTAGRPTYITAFHLRKIAPWIDQVQASGSETGFLEQCADARDWLDENILRNYRGGNVELLGYHGLALDSWFTGGARRSSLRNPFILGLLQQNGLIVTTRTTDICAYYALSRICESLIIKSGQAAQYLGLAARYKSEAMRTLTTYTAELNIAGSVDYNGNLLANIPINFSSTNTLWA